jgi:hypothetical protein
MNLACRARSSRSSWKPADAAGKPGQLLNDAPFRDANLPFERSMRPYARSFAE